MAKFKITYEYDIDTMEGALKLRDICHNCFKGNQDYIDSSILVYDNKHDMETESYSDEMKDSNCETGIVVAFSELKEIGSFEDMDTLMEALGQATEFSDSMKKATAYINYLKAQMTRYEDMIEHAMDGEEYTCDCCDDECECDHYEEGHAGLWDLHCDDDIYNKEDNTDE